MSVSDVLSKTSKPISSYELLISGLVHSLLVALSPQASDTEKCAERVHIFARTFIADSIAFNLLHKLVALLESVEKLPLYLYDAPGSYNLQAFSKRFKLILNKGNKEQNFLDFSGRVLKVEPLANISHLEKYIAKMVTKQWYDYERTSLNCLSTLHAQIPYEFKYSNDFDTNGLLYFLGTNGHANPQWLNPSTANSLVKLSVADSARQLIAGRPEDFISRTAVNCHTSGDDKRVWFCLDLGVNLIPSHYTVRYSKGGNCVSGGGLAKTAPRNWALLASKTGGSTPQEWSILMIHSQDDRLKDFGQSATWDLQSQEAVKKERDISGNGWRFFRIQQTGRNQSGANYTMSISGFELYGTVTGINNLEINKSM